MTAVIEMHQIIHSARINRRVSLNASEASKSEDRNARMEILARLNPQAKISSKAKSICFRFNT